MAAGGVSGLVGGAVGSSAGDAVLAQLEAAETVVDLDGEPVRLLTYNGLFPGP
jgi:hypothetical protein